MSNHTSLGVPDGFSDLTFVPAKEVVDALGQKGGTSTVIIMKTRHSRTRNNET
jgi:hypothetical protein